ncbi:MAG TPA: exo-alpha-sialidase, partial [Candidatus Marinimicrobia bacterium]|nr:exo-alpha-sialidase [Candidatus Neomarinimicrobiota bacterium]
MQKPFLTVLICFCTVFIVSDRYNSSIPSDAIIRARSEIGAKEDPFARWRFDWLRTRDPQTKRIPEGIRQRELKFAKILPTAEQFRLNRGFGSRGTGWRKRGPYNVGGRTRALAVDVSDVNVLLAGGVSGGMFRTTDGGNNWTKTTESEQLHSVTTIAQDPRTGQTDTWYYGTGEYSGNSADETGAFFSGNGIFKSTDGGSHWSVLSTTDSNTPQNFDSFFDYIWRVRVSPANGYVFAATYSRVYRSKNNGTTWEISLAPSDEYAPFTDLTISSTGILYAVLSSGTDKSGIYRSTDDGNTWANITSSDFPVSYNRLVLDIAPSNENVLYLLGHISGEGPANHLLWEYTYLSGDGSGSGGQWTDLSSNMPAYGGEVGDFDSQNGYDLIVKVKPDDENMVYIGGTNLYMSSDGFSSSSKTSWIGGYSPENDFSEYDNHHADQHSLVFLPSNPKVLLAGHDGGISQTQDDTQEEMVWSSLNNGYFTTQFYHVSLDPTATRKHLVMGGMQDNGTWSTDSDSETASWSKVGSGDGAFSAMAKNGEVFIYSSQNGEVTLRDYRNPLNWSSGYTWFSLTPKNSEGMLFINPFVLDPSNENIVYYAGGQVIWRNNDIDMSDEANYELDSDLEYYVATQWEQLTNSSVTATLSALGVSKQNPESRLYYGTSDGQVYRLDSANEGNITPSTVTGPNFPSGGYVSSIAVNQTNGDKAVVVFSNYSIVSVWYTPDGGVTWADVSGNLEENSDGSGNGPSVRTALIMTHNDTPYYLIGTSTGLYSTTLLNGSETEWALESSQMIGNVVVDALAGRDSDGFMVVGTHGNGVFSSSLSSEALPALSITPAFLSASVTSDGSAQEILSFSNTGQEGSTLIYEISWSYTTLRTNANNDVTDGGSDKPQ